jgi:hypothetical protein
MSAWLPVIYFARMDVDADALPRFEQWYAERHGPDLLEAGFYSAQAYHCRVGGPLVCNVYEIPSSEIFYTDGYNSKRTPEHDPDRPWILDHVSNRSNTAYAQVTTIGVTSADVPWGDGDHPGRVESPWISTARFDVDDAAADDFARWFETSLAPGWAAFDGLTAIRLLRQSGRLHPSNPSTEPQWSVLLEWSSDEASGFLDGERLVEGLAAGPARIGDVSYDVAELTLSLRRGSGS